MSITHEFLKVAARYPRKVVVVDEKAEFTYEGLEGAARRLATLLRDYTARPRVALLLPTSAAFPVSYLACQLAGKTPVPINFLLENSQIQHIVKDSGVDTVVTCAVFRDKAESLDARRLFWEDLNLDAFAPVEGMGGGVEDDLATILYTSGTTGSSKGVMLTHRNFLSNVSGCAAIAGVTERDVMIGFLPLFHSFGLTVTFLLPLLNGAKAVFLEKFHPGRVAELIESHQVSLLFAIPSMYRFFVRAVERRENRFQSLRLCVSGGEPLEDSLVEVFERVVHRPLLNGYGLTETAPVIAINRPWAARRGSIGPPLPGQEARIVDERGRLLQPGLEGELCVRGPNVMKGYLNLKEETAAVLDAEGWFRTGDLARSDPDGYLYITGRKKDLIKSSGEYISPVEVERVLAAHPSIFEAAVIGIPDPSRGEVAKAFVVLKQGASATSDELTELCRGVLARFKVPREIEFRGELPHGPTGKVLKRLLREGQ